MAKLESFGWFILSLFIFSCVFTILAIPAPFLGQYLFTWIWLIVDFIVSFFIARGSYRICKENY